MIIFGARKNDKTPILRNIQSQTSEIFNPAYYAYFGDKPPHFGGLNLEVGKFGNLAN